MLCCNTVLSVIILFLKAGCHIFIAMLSGIKQDTIWLSVVFYFCVYYYAECHYAEYRGALAQSQEYERQ